MELMELSLLPDTPGRCCCRPVRGRGYGTQSRFEVAPSNGDSFRINEKLFVSFVNLWIATPQSVQGSFRAQSLHRTAFLEQSAFGERPIIKHGGTGAAAKRTTHYRPVNASWHLEVSPAVANTFPGKVRLEVLRRRLRPLPGVDVQNGQPSVHIRERKHELPAASGTMSHRAKRVTCQAREYEAIETSITFGAVHTNYTALVEHERLIHLKPCAMTTCYRHLASA